MLLPHAYYQKQKEHYTHLLATAAKRMNRMAMLRLWSAIAAIVFGIWALRNGESWQWWLAGICAALFLVLVRIFHRLSDKKDILAINLDIIEKEIKALDGDNSFFPSGTEYTDAAHPYSYDLDLFGKGSVYQSLCRAVTVGGRKRAASKLSRLELVKESITGRQEIIRELSAMPEFLQTFRVAGESEKEGETDQYRLEQWLDGADMFRNNSVVKVSSVAMPLLSLAFIIYSFIMGGLFSGLIIVLLINLNLLGTFQKKIKLAVAQIGNIAPLIDKYESLLSVMAAQEFTADWLKKTGEKAKETAYKVAGFKKLIHLFDSRGNGFTGPLLNFFFLFDFYCLLRLEKWRFNNRESMLGAMGAMIESDFYISCAVYAFNRPGHVYPEIASSGCEICATDLRHPLLSPSAAVGNDFSLGIKEQFYLLTGANMTGKSTFIRTIGVCNVLGNIGLPVPAKELSLPLLELYTSMRITDSVQDDISYFRAELNRMKQIMDKVKSSSQPYLILLDEPLRGTNSTDKQQGTRSIVETLLTCQAIGIVATHDTGLCDMEPIYPGKVSNYHFESKVAQNGLSFDFRLKPGGSTSNNATILMRQMGIINS